MPQGRSHWLDFPEHFYHEIISGTGLWVNNYSMVNDQGYKFCFFFLLESSSHDLIFVKRNQLFFFTCEKRMLFTSLKKLCMVCGPFLCCTAGESRIHC